MSDHAIASLDGLIASLESELANDPRFELLQNLKAARAKYDRQGSGSVAAAKPNVAGSARIVTPVAGGRQMTPARAQAYEICREYLIGKAEPVKTKDLYQIMETRGCDLPGGPNNLASLLGRYPDTFKTHGRAGWTLATQQPQASTEAKTSEAADDLISRSASAASISGPPDQRTSIQ